MDPSVSVRILVLFYSFTGSTAKLAEFIAEGAKEVVNTEVIVKQVPELIPDSVFLAHQYD